MPWAEVTDARLYYELTGEGEVVLLIPGLGSTCRLLDPIVYSLNDGFCLLGVDNRGVGQSIAHRPVHTLHDYSADLIELLDHLQIERAHIVGISLGGIIAQRFAVDHPGRVNRLVLMSCAHKFGPYLREMALLTGNMLRRFPSRVFAAALEVLSAGPLYLDEDPGRVERKVIESMQTNISRMAIGRQLRALGASDPREDEYSILAPTLVISGEFDGLIPACYGRRMARAIPNSRFVLVRDAGHNPLAECPLKVLPLIMEFLRTGHVTDLDDDLVLEWQREAQLCAT
ncbi:MAG: alpha/beta fold hydrolase [Planctomycetes bacterium]|nr:alpha/beta fold hydrolase [Planctomycetota bacterium]